MSEFLEYFDEELIPSITPILSRFENRANYISPGRNRLTLIFSTYVIKLPTCLSGFSDNDWEGSVSNTIESYNDHDYIQYPKTKLIEFGGFPILFMEFVEHASYSEIKEMLGFIPDWVHSVDCGQVGFNKKGRLVAYDYGLN